MTWGWNEREDKEMIGKFPIGLKNKEEVEAQVQSCSGLFSIPGINMTKSNSGKKGFIQITGNSPWWRKAKARVQGRNLRKPRRNTAYWLAPSGLLNYVS